MPVCTYVINNKGGRSVATVTCDGSPSEYKYPSYYTKAQIHERLELEHIDHSDGIDINDITDNRT